MIVAQRIVIFNSKQFILKFVLEGEVINFLSYSSQEYIVVVELDNNSWRTHIISISPPSLTSIAQYSLTF